MQPSSENPAGPAPVHILGALALELAPGSRPARRALAQAASGEIAARIAHDLATFAPEAARLELVAVGAHYDPVELLRPGWPLHRELEQLAARAPRSQGVGSEGGRVIAFGSHDGRLPGALAPASEFSGGPLRLLPFVLDGDPATVSRVGEAFERDLLERGMAGAATALLAQDAFALQVEHARYLTAHDLAAMTALQYGHTGLGPLWPLVEAALLAPDAECWLDAPPEPLVRYGDGEARIALFSPQAWRARHAAGTAVDDPNARAQLDRRLQQFEVRQRQFAAVLQAHAVPVTFVHCPADVDCRDALG
jgi:hypothetical protein